MGLREDILEVEEKIEDLEKSTSYIHSLPYEMLQDMKKENKILYTNSNCGNVCCIHYD